MQTTTIHLFRKVKACFIFTFLLLIASVPFQSQAQQNSNPFSLDLNFGGGLIGNPNINAAFQPELGFNYMPNKLGLGLNAGFLSYNPSFDAEQYIAGFEEFTSTTKSGEKWTSFYVGIGPRFEFGSQLPVTLRSSLDLALTYNSPPESSVDFNDPTGGSGGIQLQLAGYNPGDNYSRWSAAVRPEFQIQFSPGGSDLFAINVTTGIQHRFTKNEFTYSQKDLTEVRRVSNPEEMFFQFNTAPDIQQSTNPPQTNFFSSVGIKIKFGTSRSGNRSRGRDINHDFASREISPATGSGNYEDNPCPCSAPGNKASEATDYNSSRSNTEGIANPGGGNGVGSDSTVVSATDYNSSRSNTEGVADLGGGDGAGSDSTTASATDYNSSRSNTESSGTKASEATDYNSSRSNTEGAANPGGGIGVGSDSTVVSATDYNSSRSNTEGVADLDGGDDTGSDSSGTKATEATDYNSSRSNTEGVANPGGGGEVGPVRWMAPEAIIVSGSVSAGSNPLYEGGTRERENPMYEGEMNNNDNDSDNEADAFQEYKLAPASFLLYMSGSARSGTKNSGFGEDTDGDGFPDALKGAAFSISKRSARTQNGGDDAAGLHFTLEINDPDSDDDGLMDVAEASTFSISQESSGNRESNPLYSDDGNAATNPIYESEGGTNNGGNDGTGVNTTKIWTYDLSSLSSTGGDPDADGDGYGDLSESAKLTVIHQNGMWHYNLQIDPDLDIDRDGSGGMIRNSSFSISKRSARTGRN